MIIFSPIQLLGIAQILQKRVQLVQVIVTFFVGGLIGGSVHVSVLVQRRTS